MIRVGVCDGKTAQDNLDVGQISELFCQRECVLWVDVIDPTEADWATLEEEFQFHPLAMEDAKSQNQRAKMDIYPARSGEGTGYVFFAVRAWAGVEKADGVVDATREIDIFLGQNYIVTVHPGASRVVEETRRRWQTNFADLEDARDRPSYLLYLLLDALVDDFFPVLDHLDNQIEDIEIQVYDESVNGNIQECLRKAVVLKRKLLLLRQATTPLRDVLNQLLRTDDPRLFPSMLRVYFQDVYDHVLRLLEQIDLHRDILSGAMEATTAQTSNRLNQVMKTMTAISTILMSASLIAGIYGMNFDVMPELHTRYGYFIVLGVMVLLMLGLVAFFRRIGWF